MNAIRYQDHNPPSVAVEKLIAEHGLRPILVAVLAFAIRPRLRYRTPDVLSDHLRRDIGLGSLPERRNHWDYR